MNGLEFSFLLDGPAASYLEQWSAFLREKKVKYKQFS